MYTFIEDHKTLKRLAKEGLIEWPCLINNPKRIKFTYVGTVNDNDSFTDSTGQEYHLRYLPGCFMPYVAIRK